MSDNIYKLRKEVAALRTARDRTSSHEAAAILEVAVQIALLRGAIEASHQQPVFVDTRSQNATLNTVAAGGSNND